MFERIEAEFASRLGRECLYVPSNRFGLFIALRHWMSPGQRLLMSAISPDEILFLVLAAGLRPVIAPTNPRNGNIDTRAVDGLRFDGVLSTHLYGLPDDIIALGGMCAQRGIPLIEDAAHAMQTTVMGVPVGAFGDAGVFSLSKHPGAAPGGIVAMAQPDDRPALQALRTRWLSRRFPLAELGVMAKMIARNAVSATALSGPAWWLAQALGLNERREGHRIALRRMALAPRLAVGGMECPGLDALDAWVCADNHRYRMRQGSLIEAYGLRRMKTLEAQRGRRLAGVHRLAELKTVAPAVLEQLEQPLFRVPLLVEDRERAIRKLRRHGVIVGYVYDPPFDEYAPGLTEASPAPETSRWWARHVLPIDPLRAERALPILAKLSPPSLHDVT
ncbi:DegT/DnrJ/EryC1/StrS family aminotransferase [Nonomuraea sp. NPDC050153]|uniref:DegT/DnrJ/EryC1/StrS family aminotransferase n=1 Tax=Nonomuraea sp. NPDC050153 TaxID=3364359 RepID=UPI00378B4B2B